MNSVVEPRVCDEYTELFHYTSTKALAGILSTNALWATCATHLNDSSEMQLLWSPMRSVCTIFVEDAIRSLHPEHSIDAEKYAAEDGPMMANLIRDKFLGGNSEPGWGVPFVTSFTTHKQNYHSDHGMLSQWRGYAGADGVAIVFDSKQMADLVARECERFEYFGCSISDVVYYHSSETDLLERFPRLFEAVKIYVRHLIGRRDVQDTEVLNNLRAMARELLPSAGRLKHHAFQEEHECRIIVGVPHEVRYKEMVEYGEPSIKPCKKLHYRPGVCGSVPYIRLFEVESERSFDHECIVPINRVIVGPSRNQSANVESVKALVSDLARDREIRVQRSEIPYVATA